MTIIEQGEVVNQRFNETHCGRIYRKLRDLWQAKWLEELDTLTTHVQGHT